MNNRKCEMNLVHIPFLRDEKRHLRVIQHDAMRWLRRYAQSERRKECGCELHLQRIPIVTILIWWKWNILLLKLPSLLHGISPSTYLLFGVRSGAIRKAFDANFSPFYSAHSPFKIKCHKRIRRKVTGPVELFNEMDFVCARPCCAVSIPFPSHISFNLWIFPPHGSLRFAIAHVNE